MSNVIGTIVAILVVFVVLVFALIIVAKMGRHNPKHKRVIILDALAGREKRYGLELTQATGFRSSTLYPVLDELEREKLVVGEFEGGPQPRRRAYRLTEAGLQFLTTPECDFLMYRGTDSNPSHHPAA